MGLVPENYLHRLDFEEGGGEGELVDEDKDESSKAMGTSHESTPVKSEGGGGTTEGAEQDRRREEKEKTPTADGVNT